MPVATPEQYADMLDRAKAGGFAYPAINVSSSQTINSVLQGLTEAGSDGILQVTTGGADYFAGQTVKARATGALAFAKFATEVAKNYPITVALHTDHCPKDALPGFRDPAHRGIRRRGQGRPQPDLPVAHVGRLGRAPRREHRDREGTASPPARTSTRSSRSRSASSAARRTASSTRARTTRSTRPSPMSRRPSRRSASARTVATSLR